uniref:Uncharacterized protein n=1 Tax=Noccaea caerulescens TaxID=107243 RepID=A0A1J3JKH0_NOCCA
MCQCILVLENHRPPKNCVGHVLLFSLDTGKNWQNPDVDERVEELQYRRVFLENQPRSDGEGSECGRNVVDLEEEESDGENEGEIKLVLQ